LFPKAASDLSGSTLAAFFIDHDLRISIYENIAGHWTCGPHKNQQLDREDLAWSKQKPDHH
jgi:hypothetical protein